MKSVIATEHYGVFDRTLPRARAAFAEYVRRVPLMSPHTLGYNRVWSFDDGTPLVGPSVVAHADGRRKSNAEEGGPRRRVDYPSRTAVDLILRKILRDASRLTPWLGVKGRDWVGVTGQLAVYPAGTGLSWHDDSNDYAGAFTYYVHPRWELEWGGELLLLDGPALPHLRDAVPPEDRPSDPLRGRDLSPETFMRSSGSFVMPVPDRLVVLRGGVCHTVNRVRPAAGNVPRMAISGFFIRPGHGLD